jgi:hypothetical protein
MMVNCPKCGFSQPQDQYCAKCGVDMIAYRPAQKPFIQRLVGSTAFQIVALGAVMAFTFAMVRQQQKAVVAERIAKIENAANTEVIAKPMTDEASKRSDFSSAAGRSLSADEDLPPDASLDDGESAESTSASTMNLAGTKENEASGVAAPEPAPALSASGNAGPVTAEPSAANRQVKAAARTVEVGIRFVEVPKAFLSELYNDPDSNSASYGPVQFGMVPDMSGRLKSLSSFQGRILDSSEPKSVLDNGVANVYRGPTDEITGQKFGLWVMAGVSKVDETGSVLRVQIRRSLFDSTANPPIDDIRLPLPDARVPRGGGLYISGLLPRRTTLTDYETNLYRPDQVLRVLLSESFRARETDFVILIETK